MVIYEDKVENMENYRSQDPITLCIENSKSTFRISSQYNSHYQIDRYTKDGNRIYCYKNGA